MKLLFDFPWYYALGCVLLGTAYALLLYSKGSLGKRMRLFLASLRAIAVALISMLLLQPMVLITDHVTEKPIVIIAQDRSSSVAPYSSPTWQDSLDALADKLSSDYDVQRVDYGGATTNISQCLQDLQQQYSHRNVGALVLTGDGLWNTGSNPIPLAENAPYPIFTIAMGDTAQHKDASISNLRHGRIAYMGSAIPVEVTIKATLLKGQSRRLTVTQSGKTLYTKTIDYTTSQFSTTEQLTLEATHSGLQQFVVRIEPAEGEVTTANNVRTITLEVIDGHKKVALIAAAPHPDIAALRNAIQSSENYQVDAFLAKDFKGNLKDYSLVVLHQLPSRSGIRFDVHDLPAIHILGPQTDLPQFNTLHTGVEVQTKLYRTSEAAPLFNPAFAPFTLSKDAAHALEDMPPLGMPFGDYKASAEMQSLFTAKIGNIDTRQPLISVGSQQGVRHAVIAGDGLWRWRLADYQANSTSTHFDELINKLVTYTSIRIDKQRFRLVANSIYRNDEEVVVEAELYDDNYELTNLPDARLTINGKDYPFNRSGNRYIINLGTLDSGLYACQAKTTFNGKDLLAKCIFAVEALDLEALTTIADHPLMHALAAASGGDMILPSAIDQLPDLLASRGDIKPIIYSHSTYVELIDRWWMLALIILLLSIEWVARKYNGEI